MTVRSAGTRGGSAMGRVYADYAASAPLRPCARAALAAALDAGAGNPSSAHQEGARARRILETAREQLAAVLGAHPLEIVFTSGATEANNLALSGTAAARPRPCHLGVAATEHSSVLGPARALAADGHRLSVIPVASDGAVDRAAIEAARPTLLAVALVNAETGVVQDVAALAAAARVSGAMVHVDAAQAPGVLPVAVAALGADLLTLSSPKLGGPPGAGALYVRRGTPLAALLRGGPQEGGLRAGTENVPAIAAFAAAAAEAVRERPGEARRLAALAARLREGIVQRWPETRVNGAGAARAPHILSVGFPGLSGESLVAALDLEGIAVSAGSACAAGASEPSHVLVAMGQSAGQASSALRISLGWASTAADVDTILTRLPPVLERARARAREAA